MEVLEESTNRWDFHMYIFIPILFSWKSREVEVKYKTHLLYDWQISQCKILFKMISFM